MELIELEKKIDDSTGAITDKLVQERRYFIDVIKKNQKLLNRIKNNPESIKEQLLEVYRYYIFKLGLTFDPKQSQLAFVFYDTKTGYELAPIITYIGLKKLFKRTHKDAQIVFDLVYENEEADAKITKTDRIIHKKVLNEERRGALIGAYCSIEINGKYDNYYASSREILDRYNGSAKPQKKIPEDMINEDKQVYKVVKLNTIEEILNGKGHGVWKKHPEAMIKKAIIRQALLAYRDEIDCEDWSEKIDVKKLQEKINKLAFTDEEKYKKFTDFLKKQGAKTIYELKSEHILRIDRRLKTQ